MAELNPNYPFIVCRKPAPWLKNRRWLGYRTSMIDGGDSEYSYGIRAFPFVRQASVMKHVMPCLLLGATRKCFYEGPHLTYFVDEEDFGPSWSWDELLSHEKEEYLWIAG